MTHEVWEGSWLVNRETRFSSRLQNVVLCRHGVRLCSSRCHVIAVLSCCHVVVMLSCCCRVCHLDCFNCTISETVVLTGTCLESNSDNNDTHQWIMWVLLWWTDCYQRHCLQKQTKQCCLIQKRKQSFNSHWQENRTSSVANGEGTTIRHNV